MAIGDVHGDLDALRTCLRVAGVVDTQDAWIGAPGTTLVSTGDVLDRGDEDWECLAYLHTLQAAARRKRGDVCLVLGNHEVLNVLGEMRFASTKSWHAAAEACEPPRRNVERDDDWARRARIRAFAPGGAGAAYLAHLCGDAPVGAAVEIKIRAPHAHRRDVAPVIHRVDGLEVRPNAHRLISTQVGRVCGDTLHLRGAPRRAAGRARRGARGSVSNLDGRRPRPRPRASSSRL